VNGYKKWFHTRGGVTTTIVALSSSSQSASPSQGTEKLPGKSESRKYAAGENRSLARSDPAHSAATGLPIGVVPIREAGNRLDRPPVEGR
jgi:hypothetical protein